MIVPVERGQLDLELGLLEVEGRSTDRLSGRECALLGYLIARPGADVTREELLTKAFGYSPTVYSRAVDTTVARLRKKLELDPASPRHLLTAHGMGYRWAPLTPSVLGPRRVLRLPDRYVDLVLAEVRCDDGTVMRLSAEEVATIKSLPRERSLATSIAQRHRIHDLRRKLETDPREPRVLMTRRGFGDWLQEVDFAVTGIPAPGFIRSITQHAGQTLRLEDCVVYLRRANALIQVAAWGPKGLQEQHGAEGGRGAQEAQGVLAPLELRVGEGIVGAAARRGTPVVVGDTRRDARYVPDVFAGRSELAVPVLDDNEVIGVIDTESSRVDAYPEHLQSALQSLAHVVASGLRDFGPFSPR